MKKNILILFAKNTTEVVNRKSALGSYIYCLAELLNRIGNYNFSINGNDLKFLNQTYLNLSDSSNNKQSSILKKILSGSSRRLAKDILLNRLQNKLEKSLESISPVDLIIEFYSYGSRVGYNLSKKMKVPLIVVYDAPIIDEYVFFNNSTPFFINIIKAREKHTLLHASSIVVYSNPVKEYIQGIIGTKSNIHIHQNVDFSRFEFIYERNFENKINIGFLGSFLKWHRVDILLDAFIKLRRLGKNVALYLLGDGEEFTKIKNQVINCEFAKDIVLAGFVDNEVLSDYKKQIHIGVMPSSNWYGAPNKIFEYGAAKMAVVAPNTPTIADLFENEKDLILFENESAIELFNSLLRLIDNKQLMETLATNLQQKISKKYSRENTFEFYNNLIINS